MTYFPYWPFTHSKHIKEVAKQPYLKTRKKILFERSPGQPDVAICTCDSSTWEAEKQDDSESEASLGHRMKPCLKKQVSPVSSTSIQHYEI